MLLRNMELPLGDTSNDFSRRIFVIGTKVPSILVNPAGYDDRLSYRLAESAAASAGTPTGGVSLQYLAF